MKILQVTASYKPAYVYGGPTMSVAELSEQLTTAGLSVDVFTTTANGAEELNVITGRPIDIDGVSVTYFKRITKDHSHLSPALLKTVWNRVKHYDVVHIHAWWNLISVLSCLIAVWRRVPVVVSPRGTLSAYSFGHRNRSIKRFIHAVLSRLALNQCYIHTTSLQEEQEIAALLHPKDIRTIANFVKLPAAFTTTEPNTSVKSLRLIFFSRIDAKKGIELLFEALTLVHFPYSLTIAGDGETAYINQLKQLADSYQISPHLSWIGFQHEHKFELLAGHDALVLTSYNENFANVVIESLSVGTSVIISNKVGLAAYVAQQELGWICDLSPLHIAEIINQAAAQDLERSTIRSKAPAIIRRDFSAQTLTQQYVDLYRKAAQAGN